MAAVFTVHFSITKQNICMQCKQNEKTVQNEVLGNVKTE